VDYESHAVALDRNELGALLVAAGLGPPTEHALISLLALNGLRVSEATGADIEHLGLARGYRTLTTTRKGGGLSFAWLAGGLGAELSVRCCLLSASALMRWRTWHRGRCDAGRRGSRTVVRGGHGDSFPEIVEDLSDWLVALILGGALWRRR
jgi:hypothetical protein